MVQEVIEQINAHGVKFFHPIGRNHTGNWTMPRIMLNLYLEYIFFIKNQEQFPQCSYVILHKKAKQKHVHA